jgi:Tol biopolymer transport system component/DNA-binding winged helix-turn-helix (wHTH) protein
MAIILDFNKYLIGDWLMDCNNLSLEKGSTIKCLPAKVFEVLKLLIIQDGQTITKQEIIDSIWDGNQEVGNKGLTNAIWQLRRVFVDEQGQQLEYIKTVPKIGYQLVVEVVEVEGEQFAVPAKESSQVESQSPFHYFLRYRLSFIVFVSFALLFLFAQYQQDQEKQNLTSQQSLTLNNIEQLTYLEGVEQMPDIASNGTQMAFQWVREQEPGKIYIRSLNVGSDALHQISLSNDHEGHPKFSPDNKLLAYSRVKNGSQCQLRLRELGTNMDRLLAENCLSDSKRKSALLAWSPDSKTIAYSKEVADKTAIFLLDVATKEERQLTFPKGVFNDTQVIWTPKNELYVIRLSGMRSDIYRVSLNGKEQRLTHFNLPIDSLVWHQQKELLVFNVLLDGKRQLKVLAANGELTDIAADVSPDALAYNPLTHKLIFSNYIAQEHMLLTNLDNGVVEKRFASSSRDMYGFFDPSGSKLVFNSNRTGNWELWYWDSKGSRQLSHGGGLVGLASISPDGKKYLFSMKSPQTDGFVLHQGDFNLGEASPFDINFTNISNPVWAANGESIYFASDDSGQWDIYQLVLASNEIQQKTFDGGFYAQEYGEHLLYSRYQKDGLWLLEKNHKRSRLLTDKLSQIDWGSFYSEGDDIVFIQRTAKADEVNLLTADGEIVNKLNFPKHMIKGNRAIARAADGRVIMTVLGIHEADIYQADF